MENDMDNFNVHLYSRGTHFPHELIRTKYTIRATDDVDAAMRAKDKAKAQFPGRESWTADRVYRKDRS